MAYLLTKASQRPLPRAEQIEIARRWVDGGRADPGDEVRALARIPRDGRWVLLQGDLARELLPRW